MGSRNVETDVIRNYINLILDMPWSIYIYIKNNFIFCFIKYYFILEISVDDNVSIQKAKEILNRDHYGLTKVKERILQFLAIKYL